MGSVSIAVGVPSNMQFHIPCIISHPSLRITLQFPISGDHNTYCDKQWFCFTTRQQHRTISPFYLQVTSEDESELWSNAFFAQCCNTAIRVYNKRSDTCNMSDARRYACSHHIFNVLSHSPVVCCYHFRANSRQHTWIRCFVDVMDGTFI